MGQELWLPSVVGARRHWIAWRQVRHSRRSVVAWLGERLRGYKALWRLLRGDGAESCIHGRSTSGRLDNSKRRQAAIARIAAGDRCVRARLRQLQRAAAPTTSAIAITLLPTAAHCATRTTAAATSHATRLPWRSLHPRTHRPSKAQDMRAPDTAWNLRVALLEDANRRPSLHVDQWRIVRKVR